MMDLCRPSRWCSSSWPVWELAPVSPADRREGRGGWRTHTLLAGGLAPRAAGGPAPGRSRCSGSYNLGGGGSGPRHTPPRTLQGPERDSPPAEPCTAGWRCRTCRSDKDGWAFCQWSHRLYKTKREYWVFAPRNQIYIYIKLDHFLCWHHLNWLHNLILKSVRPSVCPTEGLEDVSSVSGNEQGYVGSQSVEFNKV